MKSRDERPSKANGFKGKKFIQRIIPPPAPHATESAEFKFCVEFLRTGDLLESARRYLPERSETGLGVFIAGYKIQETLKFIAKLKQDGFIISETHMDNVLASMISYDPADAFEEDGTTIKNIHDMDVRTRLAVEQLESIKTMSGEITKIKFYSRQKALQLGMQRRNMFAENNKSKAPVVNIALES